MTEEIFSKHQLLTPEKGLATLNQGNQQKTPIIYHSTRLYNNQTTSDPIMQFVVQNFEQINVMYSAFSSKRKESTPKLLVNEPNEEQPVIEPWQSDSEEAPTNPGPKTSERDIQMNQPQKKVRAGVTPEKGESNGLVKQKPARHDAFYNEPFLFKEVKRNVRNLVASPFTKRIKDYDMADGLKVLTNLKMYDGLSDPDDHLTVFMGTMDIHKLPEPAWCRFFHIALSGAARFWYDNLMPGSIDNFHELKDKFRSNFFQQRRFQKTQAEILGIRQRHDEPLRSYLERFWKETLHMTDRSDGMLTGAFISGLHPERLFKDLIARPPSSMEELFMLVNNFIRAEEANTETDFASQKGRPQITDKAKTAGTNISDTKIDTLTVPVTGKAALRPPPRMFSPPHHRDRTRYCEFHGDHGHDTNSCVDLRKEIEECVRNGRLSHLAKGARSHNSNQPAEASRAADRGKSQIEWTKKGEKSSGLKGEILMIGTKRSPPPSKTEETTQPSLEITFSSNDPTLEDNSGEDPLLIKVDIGGTMVHRIYVDGGSSAEIMYEHCFEQLNDEQKKTMRPPKTPLVGFSGQLLWPLGVVTLSLTMSDYRGRGSKTIMAEFMVIRAPSPYNVILGRPGMRQLGAIASTIHALIKFPVKSGVATVRGEANRPSECHQITRKRQRDNTLEDSSSVKDEKHEQEGLIINRQHPEQLVTIGGNLPPRITQQLRHLDKASWYIRSRRHEGKSDPSNMAHK
ncbi:reverse transcriptase domain-containing protein [Artemisia annua]|uniref:Reverse transcriptase domain-containing protein n=1 Tax=Artemisia annua TaxID=35608 RepID=A0A2U1QA54_ARTAN|nr:reverse transcriptase domain-containing protein [Artemisia annua]